MNWIAETLWDLAGRINSGSGAAQQPPASPPTPVEIAPPAAAPVRSRAADVQSVPMQQRYDALVVEMKRAYNFRVRKWRRSMTGCAWRVHYEDGRMVRLIEAPYPRGPMSCAVFLHEVGHHAIGWGLWKPRCLEEFKAWQWSLQAMREHGFNVTAAVEHRMAESLWYAVYKARRRGLKRLPAELLPYLDRPPARRTRGSRSRRA